MTIHWILQTNIFAEEGFDTLVTAFERLGSSYSAHKVIPFVGEVTDPEIIDQQPPGTKFVPMGSYALARFAQRRGLDISGFLDNLDFEIQREHWGDRMLNHDARVFRFDAVPPIDRAFFLRPVHDTKAFTGLVISYPDYTEWRDNVLRVAEPAAPDDTLHVLTPATPVIVCPAREIYSETRCWIVGGEVVTASGYKLGERKRYSPPSEVDARITDFARECAAVWSPNPAYVLDIANTPDGLRIIEVNNLNSAGFYKADMMRVVAAIEQLLTG